MPVTYNIVYQLYFNTKILRNIKRKHKTIAHLLLQNEKKKKKKTTKLPDPIKEGQRAPGNSSSER